jgi:hypothetical protein
MEKSIQLGPNALMIGYFGDDSRFHPDAAKLIAAYEILCKKVLWDMRGALSDDQCRKEVICYYAGVQTLQAVLKMYDVEEADKKPNFNHLFEFGREVRGLNFQPTSR